MKKLEYLLIFLIVAAAFLVRLYKINRPVADWHSWRQADTAAVARNFAKDKINLLYPQADSFLIINEKGLPNPNRYFINEFPFYNAIVALLYKQFGVSTTLARLVSVAFATAGTLFLYLFTRKLFGFKVALISSLFYALNPYNIFYGSVIMPDPTFVCLSIISLYLTLLFVEKKSWPFAFLLMITFALSILVKPYAIFLLLPILYWIYINWGIQAIRTPQVYLATIGPVIPFVLWRVHILNHPEGAFASTWLLNGENIRFTGAFFRWLIFERLNRLIFATGGFVLLFFGIISSYLSKNGALIFLWFLSQILYMTIFAKGNVTHDYYQIPILPVGSILVGLGFFAIIGFAKSIKAQAFNTMLAVFLLLISFAFGWYEVRGYYNINNPAIIEAGLRTDQLLPKDAKVVADYNGDPAFLYQTNRYGYPVVERALKDYPKIGVRYLISVKPNDLDLKRAIANCPLVEGNDRYLIVQLSEECVN